jgi:hypothetical protein
VFGVACAIPSLKTSKRRKETANRSIKTAYRRFIVSLIFFSLQMLQDYRYDRTREALLKKELKTFREIVETLPKTRIAEVISSNNDRVTWCIDHPWHFTAQELIVLSDALGIEMSILVDMTVAQYRAGGNEKNKRRIRNGRKNNNNNNKH